MGERRWRVWADTGGTFTDCLAVDPDGAVLRAKVLSSSAVRGRIDRLDASTVSVDQPWDTGDGFFSGAELGVLGSGERAPVRRSLAGGRVLELERPLSKARPGDQCEIRAELAAPILAAHLLTGTPLEQLLPPMSMRIATTRGTNALLERKGAPTALFVTRGFRDLLVIGHQQRPDLFDLVIRRPEPLYGDVVEVDERMSARGAVVRAPDLDAARAAAEELLRGGVRSAAVALLNSYANPDHEREIAAALRDAGFDHVSSSVELAPLIKLLPRAQTALVDAYLGPVVGDYLEHVDSRTGTGSLHVMTSAGGLVRAAELAAKDALLSGPAGGVVGAAEAARASGIDDLIAFDMGGTSTDVSRWAGEYEYVFEHRVGEAHLVAPALAIETVAAGGGSVCHFDGHQLKVGPHSAGAEPGPASYGAGGPLTVTDVNLLLGRIVPERFGIPVDAGAARRRLDELLDAVAATMGEPMDPTTVLQGFLQIANERMAAAVRAISVQRGHDPSGATLVAFGGAGPQHACSLARLLDMRRVMIPVDAGVLSAWGLGRAVVERFRQRQVLKTLAECAVELERRIDELSEEAVRAVLAEEPEAASVEVRRCLLNLRLEGQESALTVAWSRGCDPEPLFAEAYRKTYGYDPPNRPIEVESVRVVASTVGERTVVDQPPAGRSAAPSGRHRLFAGGRWHDAEWFERSALAAGSQLGGPALVLEPHAATVVEAGWRLRVDGEHALVLERSSGRQPGGGWR